MISRATPRATTDATVMVNRHSMPPNALNRWGVAKPKVRAPTRMATRNPMSLFA